MLRAAGVGALVLDVASEVDRDQDRHRFSWDQHLTAVEHRFIADRAALFLARALVRTRRKRSSSNMMSRTAPSGACRAGGSRQMNILGISAFYHDSAAALVQDGVIAAAAQEERFTRVRHDAAFPSRAVELPARRGIGLGNLDAVVFYEKPLLKAERLLETYLGVAPRGSSSFYDGHPDVDPRQVNIMSVIRRQIGKRYRGRSSSRNTTSRTPPAPSSFPLRRGRHPDHRWSPGGATTTIGVGEGNRIRLLGEIDFPHSLGLLYSAFTYHRLQGELRRVQGDGLAPYGEPKYVDRIYQHLVRINEDGSFWLNQDYFNYCSG